MAATTLSATDLRGSARRRRKESLIRGAFLGAAAFSMIVSGAIVLALLGQAIRFLFDVDLSSLWAGGWFPRSNDFGILTLIAGTLLITAIAIAVAAPIGLGAALYLSEYADRKVRRVLKPILETLAGIPSVVLGFFALVVINPVVVQRVFSTPSTFTYMAAGIAVGILIVPLVASVAEDAMYAVPDSMREAAYGIGARRLTVSVRVVVPAAVSGIMAALILGISRAIGETMIVAIAAGQQPRLTFDPTVPVETMTAYIVQISLGDTPQGTIEYRTIFAVGMLLFIGTFGLNLVSAWLRERFREEYA
jgi:phosphate transport system permease protein